MKLLNDLSNNKSIDEVTINQLFKNIVDSTNKYMPLYEIKNLNEVVEKFNNLEFNDKKKTITDFLLATHANPTMSNLKNIGLPYFGRFIRNTGIKLSENANVIYQSPTGLFSRKIKISDF